MKKMFFEMEMVSPKEVHDFEQDLRDRECNYVIGHSEPIAFDNNVLYEVVALYGELPLEYAGCGMEESIHGYDYLKAEYEEKYGNN